MKFHEILGWIFLSGLVIWSAIFIQSCEAEYSTKQEASSKRIQEQNRKIREAEAETQNSYIQLCLGKGGIPSVSFTGRLERCDFPRNPAEAYCIYDGKNWVGPSFCSILKGITP